MQDKTRDTDKAVLKRDPEFVTDVNSRAGLIQLVEDYQLPLYRYAYRLTGATTDAEDLTQQVFLIAHQRLGQVRDPEKVRGWLFTVLRNCYLKSFRKRSPVSAVDLDLDLNHVAQDDDIADPIDRECLQIALNDLPDEFKFVLLMFYFENRSYKEIAASMDLPIGTVMSRLARGKQHLRRRLSAVRVDHPLGSKRDDARPLSAPSASKNIYGPHRRPTIK